MASSIIGGLIENGFPATSILVSDPVTEGRQKLQQTFGVTTATDNAEVCAQADIVVLAVKPQILKAVAEGIATVVPNTAVVVSIAAGIPLSALQHWLGKGCAIVRCMPNTPALVHLGASGLHANSAVTADQKSHVESLFNAIGTSTWLESEADLDAVTALSGSGPAYFFLMIEAMTAAGTQLGLTPETARQLSLQTALGAATMAYNSDVDCAELRRRVTSPGGTTEKAITTFQAGGFTQLVASAMQAASDRAKAMADEFSQ